MNAWHGYTSDLKRSLADWSTLYFVFLFSEIVLIRRPFPNTHVNTISPPFCVRRMWDDKRTPYRMACCRPPTYHPPCCLGCATLRIFAPSPLQQTTPRGHPISRRILFWIPWNSSHQRSKFHSKMIPKEPNTACGIYGSDVSRKFAEYAMFSVPLFWNYFRREC